MCRLPYMLSCLVQGPLLPPPQPPAPSEIDGAWGTGGGPLASPLGVYIDQTRTNSNTQPFIFHTMC